MSAIVKIAGQQIRVQTSDVICVDKLDNKVDSSVEFKEVLLLQENNNIILGTPLLQGAQVVAKILEHGKDDKVIVYKKKPTKGYAKKNGHRQLYTKIYIEKIINT